MKAGITTQFATAARLLAGEAERYGLDVPGFRSPPRVIGFDRTIRRRPTGGVIAVALRGRPFVAVLADMIEGIVVINKLQSPEADRVRSSLWTVLNNNGQLIPGAPVDAVEHQGLQTRVA